MSDWASTKSRTRRGGQLSGHQGAVKRGLPNGSDPAMTGRSPIQDSRQYATHSDAHRHQIATAKQTVAAPLRAPMFAAALPSRQFARHRDFWPDLHGWRSHKSWREIVSAPATGWASRPYPQPMPRQAPRSAGDGQREIRASPYPMARSQRLSTPSMETNRSEVSTMDRFAGSSCVRWGGRSVAASCTSQNISASRTRTAFSATVILAPLLGFICSHTGPEISQRRSPASRPDTCPGCDAPPGRVACTARYLDRLPGLSPAAFSAHARFL